MIRQNHWNTENVLDKKGKEKNKTKNYSRKLMKRWRPKLCKLKKRRDSTGVGGIRNIHRWVDGYGWRRCWGGGGPPSPVPDGFLLRLGEFQSVAEDLDSLLFMTESTCLGRLTADTEQMPGGSQRASQRQDTTWLTQRSWRSRGGESYRPTATPGTFVIPLRQLLGPGTHSLHSSKSLWYY